MMVRSTPKMTTAMQKFVPSSSKINKLDMKHGSAEEHARFIERNCDASRFYEM